MAAKYEKENTVLSLWFLLSRVGDQLNRCYDVVFSKYGITAEQSRVLAAIELRGPLRPVDMASMSERAPNSMSMLVDRMVKAGLVRRTRDRKDRRAVFVSLTNKGREAIKPALPAGWEFINRLLSPLPYDEQRALASTLEKIKCDLTRYLSPEMDKAEIVKTSFTANPHLYKEILQPLLSPGYQLKSKRRKK
jgi:DNA-binding MarR family transcriptional regulator